MRFKTKLDNSEKKALFSFLEKNSKDKLALDFVKRWFNCSQMTIMLLMIKKNEKI